MIVMTITFRKKEIILVNKIKTINKRIKDKNNLLKKAMMILSKFKIIKWNFIHPRKIKKDNKVFREMKIIDHLM